MRRRDFFKLTGAAGVAAASAPEARSEDEGDAESKGAGAPNGANQTKAFVGVLVDTTRCIGCRTCEVACAAQNGLPIPDVASDRGLDSIRTTGPDQYTVVNRFETDRGEVFVKKQCLHC